MSLINEYTKKEQLLKQLQAELQQLEQDDRLKAEIEFKDKLEALMSEYSKNPGDVIQMIAPERAEQDKAVASNEAQSSRRKRKLKVYKNPNTGEVIETRGGNHKTLKAWKEEYGNDTVESWLEREGE
ncbi:histone-like nucleoid-structuring protein, MvaT/MvaU family [Phytohalomonas tamaricis]|uniref:histone-like nucleoid-structuring protein, MvaT/MvaU family n=1 Tax=Phytohalomonas tamaricis TaxID=2081032 RepID=UPI000D0BE240|nr:histone-like nucleoid-structuring protein, MvaT/MvaU family [Phytohalomonas tamaricis]